jgi:transposase
MHNDDSTIVLIDNFEGSAFEISHKDNLADLSKNEENPSPQQKTVSHEEEPSEDKTTKRKAVENFKKAVSELLDHYDGKKSINKIFTWLKDFLYPIIKDFLKR